MHSAIGYEAWKELLQFAYDNSETDFYKRKYSEAGFDPHAFCSLEAITSIPFLNKSELAAVPTQQLCFVPEADVQTISPTSGTTTGTPLITFLSPSPYSPRKAEGDDFGRSLVLYNPFRGGVLMYYYQLRKEVALLGDIHNLPATVALAARAEVRTIMTTPTIAIILKKYLDVHPELYKSLTYLRLGGEIVTPSKKRLLRELYPDLQIITMYASSEVGRAASQCIALSHNDDACVYHPDQSGYHLEIVDPQTGENLPYGATGELVITDFTNRGTPLIRYKTGDAAQLFEGAPCACGKSGPFLMTQGRLAYDSIRAGGFEIRKDIIEKPLLMLRDQVTANFEAHIYENYINEKPHITLKLHLQLQDGGKETSELKQFLAEVLQSNIQISPSLTFAQALDAGLFAPLSIELTEFPQSIKAVQKLILH